MIIWGGWGGGSPVTNTGGRYNPDTNTWTATSTINAPTARVSHAAVCTGTEMIVWGGWDDVTYFDTGSRYNPSTDNWTDITNTNAPSARECSSAMWTGSEMIVWGGHNQRRAS